MRESILIFFFSLYHSACFTRHSLSRHKITRPSNQKREQNDDDFTINSSNIVISLRGRCDWKISKKENWNKKVETSVAPTIWDRTKMLKIPGEDESMCEPFTKECHCRQSWIMRLSVARRLCCRTTKIYCDFSVLVVLFSEADFSSSRFTHTHSRVLRLASFWWSAYRHEHYLRFETRKGKNANKEVLLNSIQYQRHLFTALTVYDGDRHNKV